ncbi:MULTISPECIES: fibrobacter succinogenes major paralogous domain-containing protein [unclassified Fibrobacter]|uniref:fibrobacter succinogenes major paralogous domain-containing protein n=1 Tax=unclassified Fibrobacter TaxID=2634177 RepID=UPI0025C5A044|nr:MULTISPECIES: fibrobacter succinogenes major paralogous domain-containing protein [unclassified Fibrobacter]
MSCARRLLPLLGATFFLAACGDDNGESILDELMLADYVVDDADGLKECNEDRDGMTAYLKDADSLLVCKKGNWIAYDTTRSGDEKSSSSAVSSSSDGGSGIEDEFITGMSPFETLTAVSVLELDGETLEETGRVYRGWSTGGLGGYEVHGVTLASQYAAVEISGNYRLAVSGSVTDIPVTLKALVDFSETSSVNVNLLTHLEYARVRSLVASGKSVADARQQAESEILDALGIEGSVGNFGDLDIAYSDDGSAILLAVDVIIQGDVSDVQLLLRLKNFAGDIERNGEWKDSTVKTEMADWAMQADLGGKLAAVRKNMESWGLDEVPNFEKHVRMFWANVFGLGKCDAKNEGKRVEIANELSIYYGSRYRFLCSDGEWVADIRLDFEDWEAVEDGSIRWSETGDCYKYDESLEKWVVATPREYMLGLGGCTEKRKGLVLKSNMDYSYYMCSDIGWKRASQQDYDTYGHECASDNEGEVALLGDEEYTTYYICKSDGWDEALEIEYDTYGLDCASKNVGDIKYGVVTGNVRYYCTANGWVNFDEWNWDIPTESRLRPDISYGTLTDSRDGQKYRTIVVGSLEWTAQNMNYAPVEGSYCYDDNADHCKVAGRLYDWQIAVDSACPEGWHLPTQAEYKTLVDAMGGSSKVGPKLKTTSGWNDGWSGSDSVGFAGIPAGYRYNSHSYEEGYRTGFWTSERKDILSYAYFLPLNNSSVINFSYDSIDDYAYYVRCVREVEE